MKKHLLFVAVILLLNAATASAQNPVPPTLPPTAEQTCEELKKAGASQELLAKRGCCSWHQGVCGCSNSRVVCCDGTYSPTCTCNKDDPEGVVN